MCGSSLKKLQDFDALREHYGPTLARVYQQGGRLCARDAELVASRQDLVAAQALIEDGDTALRTACQEFSDAENRVETS